MSQRQSPKSFSLSDGDPGARSWLRQVLRYQFASEVIRHARDQLAVLLAGSSCVLWVAAAWPSLLAESLVRAALVVWAMLLAATLAAFGLERRWLRLQTSRAECDDACRALITVPPPPVRPR